MKMISIKNILMGLAVACIAIVGSARLYLFWKGIPLVEYQKKVESPQAQNPGPVPDSYFVNYSNTRRLVASMYNIFAAKVVRKIGDEKRHGDPESQWEVEVIYNIKGNLSGLVTIQNYFNKHSLQPGSTYIFLTRGNPTDGYFLNPDPVFSKLITGDSNLSNTKLAQLAEDDVRVQELLVGYVYESIPGETEAEALKRPNNYISLSEAEKQVVLSKIKYLPPAPPVLPLENTEEFCSDGIDNDGNEYIDTIDPKCAPFLVPVTENTKALCSDKIDNDYDVHTDLRDPDCAAFVTAAENSQELCSDGIDNDRDGWRDSKDSDCQALNNPLPPPPPPAPAPTPTSTSY